MQRHGKRFEVACYRNKILNYRQGIERDLSEVLQTDRVFTNVSKGQFASSKDLQMAFGTTDQDAVCKIILDSGQIQVSDLERNATLENTTREVANMVANKCVHPVSNRQYTVTQIRDAMKKAEFSVQPVTSRSVKQQFLDCVKAIQEKRVLDIQRAKMELSMILKNGEDIIEILTDELKKDASASIQHTDQKNTIQFLIDPSFYRKVDAIAKAYNAKLEILRQIVREEMDIEVTLEVERKTAQEQEALSNSDNEDNIAIASAMARMNIKDDDGDDNRGLVPHTYSSDEDKIRISSRKQNKNAAKKSKKARRREKENEAIRKERIDTEMARRKEREERLEKAGSVQENIIGMPTPTDVDSSRKSCNTCGGSFSAAGYRAHFKSDWHRYNQQLKLKGIAPVEEKEFNMISELI
jgi:ribosome maturation protein SDO1